MFAALADVGRHIGTLVAAARGGSSGDDLLALAKIVETHTTLMQGLRDASAAQQWSDQLAGRVQVRGSGGPARGPASHAHGCGSVRARTDGCGGWGALLPLTCAPSCAPLPSLPPPNARSLVPADRV